LWKNYSNDLCNGRSGLVSFEFPSVKQRKSPGQPGSFLFYIVVPFPDNTRSSEGFTTAIYKLQIIFLGIAENVGLPFLGPGKIYKQPFR